MLYTGSPGFIYLITGSLYLLTQPFPSPHSTLTPTSDNHRSVSVSIVCFLDSTYS